MHHVGDVFEAELQLKIWWVSTGVSITCEGVILI